MPWPSGKGLHIQIPFRIDHDSSVITRSHFSSKIFTASVNSTSGGNAPVDSMVTRKIHKKWGKIIWRSSYLIGWSDHGNGKSFITKTHIIVFIQQLKHMHNFFSFSKIYYYQYFLGQSNILLSLSHHSYLNNPKQKFRHEENWI